MPGAGVCKNPFRARFYAFDASVDGETKLCLIGGKRVGRMFRSWHPEVFQGSLRRRNYFEGWYFKLIDGERRNAIAVIPGISIGKSGEEAHSFVQYIDAVTGKTRYFRYPIEDFKTCESRFEVSVGPNRFSRDEMFLDISQEGSSIAAHLKFSDIVAFPARRPFPGVMGPFTFLPGMECYHGVVNISHRITGSVSIDGRRTDFTQGEGYIEKDWGRSFPDSWTWMQANHFEKPGSFMFSLASIPYLGRSFPGMVSFLLIEGKLTLFTTYNFSKLRNLKAEGRSISASVRKGGLDLEIRASYGEAGELYAPKNGMMTRRIMESISAEIEVRLSDRAGKVLFEGKSGNAGLEICGEIGRYGRAAQRSRE